MLMMLPFEAPTIFEGIHKSYFRMPRVVKDQRSRFENDDLFRQLSHESAVKYTGFKDRPLSERQNQFITDCYLGHTEVSVVQSGNQFTLMFTPTANPAYDHEGCFIDKEQGKAHIKAGFILNGVCVLWRGWIDLQRLEGFGCLEFDEYRAYLEDAMAKQQADGSGPPKQPMCNNTGLLGQQQQQQPAPPLGRLNHHHLNSSLPTQAGGGGGGGGGQAPSAPAAINHAAAAAAAVAAAATTNSMLPMAPPPPVGLNSSCLTAAAAAAASAGLPGGQPGGPPVSLAESAAAAHHYGNAAIAAAAAAAFHQALSVGPPPSLNGLHGLAGMNPQAPPPHSLVANQHLTAYTQQTNNNNTSPPHQHQASPTHHQHPFLNNNINGQTQISNGHNQAPPATRKQSPERENYSSQLQGIKRPPSAQQQQPPPSSKRQQQQQQELDSSQTDEVDVVSDISELDFPPRRMFKSTDSIQQQQQQHGGAHKISRRA